jgi:hypothetical protein
MSSRINLNDPDTWDVSDSELEELAKTGGKVEAEEGPAEEEAPKLRPLTSEKPAEEAPEEAPEETPEQAPAGIAAADGKNVIPYGVLKATRSELAEARYALEEAQRALAEMQRQPAATAAPAAQQEAFELPADVRGRIEKARENWGEDIANEMERTWWIEQQTLYQKRMIDELTQHIEAQKSTQQYDEQMAIEDAIAASPTLDEWARAEDQTDFDRAVELHGMLLKTDREYGALSWFDRMRVLPDKVNALYGSPPAAPPAKAPVDPKKKLAEAMDAPPKSLSDLTGGAVPEKNDITKLEDLSGNELTAYMGDLMKDPKKFEAYLRNVS